MDYHSLKRQELQALCKEHNIPANTANSVMADKLSQLLNDKKKPSSRRRACLKSSSETVDESDSAMTRRQAKKVRFSPDNEVVEYELRSGRKEQALVTETKSKRKSVAKKPGKPVVPDVDVVGSTNDGGGIPIKLTRSRVQVLQNDGVVPLSEKQQGKRKAKEVEKESAPKETEVISVRSTRSKGQTIVEDRLAPDLVPEVKSTRSRGDAKDTEPSKETVDTVPSRVTRSRVESLKENIENTVANLQADKKRTRREMKVADQSNNSTLFSGSTAPKDTQELPKRKSLRSRDVDIADDEGHADLRQGRQKKRSKESTTEVSENLDHADKGLNRRSAAKVEEHTVSRVEVVNGGANLRQQKKRSKESTTEVSEKQDHADKGLSRRRNAKVEESTVSRVEVVNEPKVTRSRAQLAIKSPEKELVPHLEEAVNRPSKKNNRQKGDIKQAEEKGVDKPVDRKKKTVKETERVELPNVPTRRSRRSTVPLQPDGNFETHKNAGKNQSKVPSDNLSTAHESSEDKEHVTRSGKYTSRSEINAVASATSSHRSRKRGGDSIVEEPAVEVEYPSPVDESSKRLTRGANKSEGKAVMHPPQKSAVKNQQQSSLKTPASRKDKKPVVKDAFAEGQQSGTGRALRSGEVIRDNTSKKRAKLSLSPHGTKQSAIEKGFVDKSKTEETSGLNSRISEIKQRDLETEFTPAVDESAGRVTRSTIKNVKNVASKQFEKADKKKLRSQSAVKGQHVEHAQMEVAEGRPDTAVVSSSRKTEKSTVSIQKTTQAVTEIGSETSEESNHQILVNLGDLSASEFMRSLATDVETENKSETEVKIAASSVEIQVSRSAIPEAYAKDTEMTKSKSRSAMLEIDEIDKESDVSAGQAVVIGESVDISLGVFTAGNNAGADDNCVAVHYETGSASDCHASVEQSDVRTKLKEIEAQLEPSINEGVTDDRVEARIEKESEQEPLTGKDRLQNPSVSEHEDASGGEYDDEDDAEKQLMGEPGSEGARFHTSIDIHQSPDDDHDVANDGVDTQESGLESSINKDPCQSSEVVGHGVEPNIVDTQKELEPKVEPATVDHKLQDLAMGENDNKDNVVSGPGGLAEHDEASNDKNLPEGLSIDVGEAAEDLVDVEKEPVSVQEPVVSKVQTAKELESESVPSSGEYALEVPVLGKYDGQDGIVNTPMERESDSKPSTVDIVGSPVSDIVADRGVDAKKESEYEPRSSTGDDVSDTPMLGKVHPLKKLESDPRPSNRDVESDAPVLGDDYVMKDLESEPKSSTGNDQSDTPESGKDDVIKEYESEMKPSTGDDVSGTSVLGNDDVIKELASDPDPSTAGNILEIPVSNCDAEDECAKATNDLKSVPNPSAGTDACDTFALGKDDAEHDNFNATKELECGSEPSTGNLPEDPALGSNLADERANLTMELELKPTSSTSNGVQISTIGKSDVEDDKSNGQDTDSVQEPQTGNDSDTMDEQDTGDDGDNAQDENTSVLSDALIGPSKQDAHVVLNATVNESAHDTANGSAPVGWSDPSTSKETHQTPATGGNDVKVEGVDAQEDSIPNEKKDLVSEISEDSDGHRNVVGVTDIKNDSFLENEQKIVDTLQFDQGVQSKESENVPFIDRDIGSPCSPNNDRSNSDVPQTDDIKDADASVGMAGDFSLPQVENSNNVAENVTEDLDQGFGTSTELRMEEAEMATEGDHVLVDITEETAATVDHDLSRDTHMDSNNSEHGVDESDSPLTGNMRAHESPVREEASPPAHKQEESGDVIPFSTENQDEEAQNISNSEDWGNHSFGRDEFQKPVLANRSNDALARDVKDDIVSNLFHTSAARASSYVEVHSSPASHLYSVTNVADERSLQAVDTMRATVNVTTKSVDVSEGFYNWSEDSSLKEFFATPSTNRTSQVKDCEEDAVTYAFPDDRCQDSGRKGASEHDFHHQWGNKVLEVSDFNEETQDPTACKPGSSDDPDDEMFTVPNFDDFSHQYFDDKEGDQDDYQEVGGMSGKNEKFVFKDDEVVKIKQYDLLSEEAGTSQPKESDSAEPQENKETQLRGDPFESTSEVGDDLSLDKVTPK